MTNLMNGQRFVKKFSYKLLSLKLNASPLNPAINSSNFRNVLFVKLFPRQGFALYGMHIHTYRHTTKYTYINS